MYDYQAEVIRVVDGDTVWLRVDCGFDLRLDMTVRLYGINAPEVRSPEGRASKYWMEQALPVGSTVGLKTYKDKREKYGRYLGTLIKGTTNLNESMLAEGMAVRYMP